MNLELHLNENSVALKLGGKTGVIDFAKASYYHDLDSVLISLIDKLLKKHKISAKSLKTFKILGGVKENSTSYKIALSFIQALKAGF